MKKAIASIASSCLLGALFLAPPAAKATVVVMADGSICFISTWVVCNADHSQCLVTTSVSCT